MINNQVSFTFLCRSLLRGFSLWAAMWGIDLDFIENARV